MSKKAKQKRIILFFPILVAAFPILHLYDVNVDQVHFSDVLPSLIKSIGGVCVLWGLIWLMKREPRRAAITASILVSLYYFYFTYSGWVAQTLVVVLVTNWLIYFLYQSKSDFRAFVTALNVGSAVMAGAAVFGIVSQLLNPPPMETGHEFDDFTEEQVALMDTTPNIYYILLDGYSGSDALRQFYRTNNSEFIDFLHDQGFWVGEHARSNYVRTLFSLPSTMNMDYLHEFVEKNDLVETTDERPAFNYLKQSKVRLFLQRFGYTSVGMSSGFTGWDMFGVQQFKDYKRGGANEFQSIVNQHTPLFPIAVALAVMDPFQKHRELQELVIGKIPELPKMFPEHPIVGFVHVMCPHPPFVFLRDGSPAEQKSPLFNLGDGDYIVGTIMNPVEYQTAYSNQLYHLNTLMEDAVARLRENDPEAIIILQGDHGGGSGYHATDIYKTNFLERTSILNAVYLPRGDYEDFYPTISPVNTFRIIFNRYFGEDYELLPDEVYYSMANRPYEFHYIEFGGGNSDAAESTAPESAEEAPVN